MSPELPWFVTRRYTETLALLVALAARQSLRSKADAR